MNIFLWVLQGLLAVHTLMGAIWKFKTTAEQTMPSLGAIPQTVWLGFGVVEIFFAIGLVLPAVYKPMALAAPISAIGIASIMVIYCVLHLLSGSSVYGPMIYWIVVASVCAFIAYGRLALR